MFGVVEMLQLLCHYGIWVNILECLVLCQPKELAELVQTGQVPRSGLDYAKYFDRTKDIWDTIGAK